MATVSTVVALAISYFAETPTAELSTLLESADVVVSMTEVSVAVAELCVALSAGVASDRDGWATTLIASKRTIAAFRGSSSTCSSDSALTRAHHEEAVNVLNACSAALNTPPNGITSLDGRSFEALLAWPSRPPSVASSAGLSHHIAAGVGASTSTWFHLEKVPVWMQPTYWGSHRWECKFPGLLFNSLCRFVSLFFYLFSFIYFPSPHLLKKNV